MHLCLVDLIELSKKFVHRAKIGNDCVELTSALGEIHSSELLQEISTDTAKKVFWINLYNAYVLLELNKQKKLDYSKQIVHFQDKSLTLDEIEHGILRGSKSKLALGYLRCISVSDFEKQKVSH